MLRLRVVCGMGWVDSVVGVVCCGVGVVYGGISREGRDLSPCVVPLVDLHPQLSMYCLEIPFRANPLF